jgi:hypothetical protein
MKTKLTLLLSAGMLITKLNSAEITTNLPVTIKTSLSTNVVSGDNSKGCELCDMMEKSALSGYALSIFHLRHQSEPYRLPTERWVISNVVRTTFFHFSYSNQVFSRTEDETISSFTNRWGIFTEWKPLLLVTNTPLTVTNVFKFPYPEIIAR